MSQIQKIVSTIISKLIDWISSRVKKDDKQKESSVIIVNGDVIIINISDDGDKSHS